MLTTTDRVGAIWSADAPVERPVAAERSPAGSKTLAHASSVVLGVSGARQNATAALIVDGRVQAVCEQERLTRVRRTGLSSGLPEEAIAAVLKPLGGRREDIRTYAACEEEAILPDGCHTSRFDHHLAHAATAYLTSSFDSAAVLVCDRHSGRQTSVWKGQGSQLSSIEWPASGPGPASVYSECSALFGFGAVQEHRLEALARLSAGDEWERLLPFFSYTDGQIVARQGWREYVRDWLYAGGSIWSVAHGAKVAASFQRALGHTLLLWSADACRATGSDKLCLGGGLFYNTYFSTLLSRSLPQESVHVAPNPGNPGLSVGVGLLAAGSDTRSPQPVSPFLGPEYDLEQIKATVDNCKLSYECLSEREIVNETISALVRGRLVGWFQGRMEWGHRALGNRSILANPLSPYVLDNLNVFLKQREPYRAYSLSAREETVHRYFAGPARSSWMQYDYDVLDPERFKAVIPDGTRTLRLQTVNGEPPLFRDLHRAFEEATGLDVLVNTSFNAFAEPIVCSPRDAIRVFYGTGLDMLVLGRFIIRK